MEVQKTSLYHVGQVPRNANDGHSYQASSTGSTTTLLYLVAVCAHLDQHHSQSLGLYDQTLQELRPAARISTHGRVYPSNILIPICPLLPKMKQVHVEILIHSAEDINVGQVVVEHVRHASDGSFNYYIAVEQLTSIRAIFEEAVELVYMLHGHAQAFVPEQHILQTAVEIFARLLQEAIDFVDVLEQNVGNVGHGLLQALVQQMHAEDDLRNSLDEWMELALGVVSPMAIVGEVVRELGDAVCSTHQLLASLDALLGVGKGHMACLAGGIEH